MVGIPNGSGLRVLPPRPACACATYDDGSTHRSLCALHADTDPTGTPEEEQ